MPDEVKAVTINIKTAGHEQLDELIGGDDTGHYHLDAEEYSLMTELLEDYKDELDDGEDFYKLRASEHERLLEILDILCPDEEDDPEEVLAEIINARITEHDIIDGGEVV